jgi:hypothetical protein
MKDALLALPHLAVTAAELCRRGGVRAMIAENLLLKQQLIVVRRGRQRSPHLTRSDRVLCVLWPAVQRLQRGSWSSCEAFGDRVLDPVLTHP